MRFLEGSHRPLEAFPLAWFAIRKRHPKFVKKSTRKMEETGPGCQRGANQRQEPSDAALNSGFGRSFSGW
jgi:hypothetical protein